MTSVAMKMTVIMPEGSTEVIVGPKVQVEFEREFKMGVGSAFGSDDPKLEHLYWMAWRAQRHIQKTALDFEEWLDVLVDVELDDDEDGSDPGPLDHGP